MSKKFCPLGFFSFYVNKSKAEAGGGHHCVEENCALWHDEYEDCSLKIGLDSLTVLADNFGSGQRMPIPERRVEVEAPKLSIFDKLRRKTEGQRLPTIETPVVMPSAPTIITTPLPTSPTVPPTPTPISSAAITAPEELLKPPDVPLDALPIISITSKEN